MDSWYEANRQVMTGGSPQRMPLRMMPASPMSLGVQGISHLQLHTSMMESMLAGSVNPVSVPTDMLALAAASAHINLDNRPPMNPRVEAIMGDQSPITASLDGPDRLSGSGSPVGSPISKKDSDMLMSPST